jgi:THO complex subunit 2
MADLSSGKGDEAKPTGTSSRAGSTTSSVAADINQDPSSGDQPRSRPDSGRQADIPKRPDIRQQVHPPVRPPPRHNDGRLPPRPEGLDDRRDRHSDFGPRGRHGGGPDHGRTFDGPLNDVRGRLNERLGDRDRDFPMRPAADDLIRGPPRESRAGRENGWPMDRPGRMRGPGPGPGPGHGPNDSFHGRDGPVRGELMPDHMDRPVDSPRRGDSSRPDKDDRRPYPSRPLSPPRPADLPNRPERFQPPDDRRPPGFTGSSRIDDLPRGPRSDRQVDTRDSAPGPDLTHGRLRQPEPLTDIPAGPRGRRVGRNASGQPPPNTSSANATTPLPDRQAPTGPSRQNGRAALEQPAVLSQPSGATTAPGIHPDRLRLVNDAPPNAPPSGPRGGPTAQQVPRGPASSSLHSGPPGPPPPSGPAGAGYGGERGRGDKRFAGLNTVLQQSGGGDRTGNPPPVRGRGANRQPNTMEAPPVQPPNRPPMGPAGPQEDQSRTRPNGGRVADLIDDVVVPEPGRSGRTGDPNREKDPERRDGSNNGRNRRDGRRSDRERSRRSDVGGGGSRDEKERTGEPRETLRRVQSSREELRRRDRRDRPDGPPEMAGPTPSSSNVQEGEGRLRPSSSQGAPPPPPPPPPPPMPAGNDRRFNAGGDRGPRTDNRDRERERRGDRRDRENHRDGGSGSGASGHRKRTRPGPEDNNDGARGMRMGNDNKRPRRGA